MVTCFFMNKICIRSQSILYHSKSMMLWWIISDMTSNWGIYFQWMLLYMSLWRTYNCLFLILGSLLKHISHCNGNIGYWVSRNSLQQFVDLLCIGRWEDIISKDCMGLLGLGKAGLPISGVWWITVGDHTMVWYQHFNPWSCLSCHKNNIKVTLTSRPWY